MFYAKVLLAWLALSVWLIAASAQPPEPFQRWPQPSLPAPELGGLTQRLEAVDRRATQQGYFPTQVQKTGTLRVPQMRDTFALTLWPGHYLIAVECDAHCDGLGFGLREMRSRQVLPVEEPWGYPVVFVDLPYTSDFSVMVWADRCASRSCFYGMKVYAVRSEPTPPPVSACRPWERWDSASGRCLRWRAPYGG